MFGFRMSKPVFGYWAFTKNVLMWIYTQKITYKTYDTFKNKNIKSKVKYREK